MTAQAKVRALTLGKAAPRPRKPRMTVGARPPKKSERNDRASKVRDSRKQRAWIPRKRAKLRRWKSPRCIYETPTGRHTCVKPQKHLARCKPHADLYLDGLVRDKIAAERTGVCKIKHADVCACSGALQVNHGFKRGHHSTRWLLGNVVDACGGLNTWAHNNEARWHDVFRRHVGEQNYAVLKALAYDANPRVDYEATERELRATLEKAKEAE